MTNQLTVFNLIDNSQQSFEEANNGLSFEKEKYFAGQLLSATDYATKIAMNNQASVFYAMTNLASVGLSLNPATKFAYLVPRDNKICLDISYMGLIKIATDSGAVRWVKSEVVYKNDKFTFNGVGKTPTHECDPFGDRGDIVGFYCVAKTSDGDYLCGMMSVDEVNTIRNRSKAFTSGKPCPWTTDYIEMAKKTIIKRDSKTWPKSERMNEAAHILNEHEGYKEEYLTNTHQEKDVSEPSEAQQIAVLIKSFVDSDDAAGLLDLWMETDNEILDKSWRLLESPIRSKAKLMIKEERDERTINQ